MTNPKEIPDASDFDLSRIAGYRLSALSNRLTLWSARVYRREFGVSSLEWRVLASLAALGPVTARDVAEFAVLDKSNVSRAVHRLTHRGFIERCGHPVDGRSRILTLTKEGRILHGKISAHSRQRDKELFRGFTESERESFAAFLTRLDERARLLLRATER
ncbi:MAG: MarR family transcriptional regulator [Defluviicoccus sp.]|nr:MarR family transcriptional regulator [Defluviicoccus sp.]